VAPAAEDAVELAVAEDEDRLARPDRPTAPLAATVTGEVRPPHAEHRFVEVARPLGGVSVLVDSVSPIPHGPLLAF
jgi:hypothetical protein